MIIGVIGPREFTDYESYRDLMIDSLDSLAGILIGAGDREGTDQLTKRFCTEHSIPLRVVKLDWVAHESKAPIARVKDIISASDKLIIFFDGKSESVKKAMQHCIRHPRKVVIFI